MDTRQRERYLLHRSIGSAAGLYKVNDGKKEHFLSFILKKTNRGSLSVVSLLQGLCFGFLKDADGLGDPLFGSSITRRGPWRSFALVLLLIDTLEALEIRWFSHLVGGALGDPHEIYSRVVPVAYRTYSESRVEQWIVFDPIVEPINKRRVQPPELGVVIETQSVVSFAKSATRKEGLETSRKAVSLNLVYRGTPKK